MNQSYSKKGENKQNFFRFLYSIFYDWFAILVCGIEINFQNGSISFGHKLF